MPFVSDVVPLVISVVVRLAVCALPRAPAAPMVAGAPAPFAVPAPDAVRGRVVVRVNRVDHDARARPRYHDAGGQQQRSRANHRPSRLHRTLQLLVIYAQDSARRFLLTIEVSAESQASRSHGESHSGVLWLWLGRPSRSRREPRQGREETP